jgi:hypothetical protein
MKDLLLKKNARRGQSKSIGSQLIPPDGEEIALSDRRSFARMFIE